MITTFTGSNDFARMAAESQAVQAFINVHTGMAVERLDGETSEAPRMFEAIQNAPFLTMRKLVVLREPSHQKAFAESFADQLARIPETTDVFIVEPKLDKRLSYYKTLQRQTDFRDFPELDASGLAKWAMQYAGQKQGSLSQPDARYLIDRVGTDQLRVQNELDKLLLYNSQVTTQTIDMLTDRVPQSTVFELIDAAFAGRVPQALALYAEQRAARVEPQAIVAMIVWQMHILATVKMAGMRDAQTIAKQAKINPFVVRKTQNLARKIVPERLKTLIAQLVELDMRLKRTATNPDEAVQLYIMRLAE
ncbi:MAG TPA: DNA polymerase III subunit delta [Candidatus Saccharimonadales bacterium]|nr:DNA polymerase III subunit delta [Candidatus Saccharimonadales bacterium]